ncbi:MAG: lipocalin-like domain-containing protein [Chloroflexota bacterium]
MKRPIIFGVTPEFMAHEGLADHVQNWEDGLRAPTGRGTFEWWYFDAHFDDPASDAPARGSTAVIVFATKPLLERNGPLKPGVSLTITRPDGSKLAQFPFLSADQFSASKESCDVHIGPSWTRGDLQHYQVHVEVDGMSADLIFTSQVPAWRPGAGKSYFGDMQHYFGWLPAIPYGKVEGSIHYDGQTYHVQGSGYHDHNWGNVGLNEVMDHWYWGRAHLGEYTLIYVEQIGAKEYGYTRMPVFMLAKGSQVLTGDGLALTMQSADFVPAAGGRAYPRQLDFHWEKGEENVHLRLREPTLIEGTSLLISFPAWQRALLRLVANPYYFRFNARLELSIHMQSAQAELVGPALYEIMILQGQKHP